MIKKEVKGIGQDIFYEVLENGLRIFLVPFKNRKNYYINYVTIFGSTTTNFIPYGGNDFIKVPYGVAHFLEHKMFEQESGEDPFEFFSKYGSDANAATGYNTTAYTVEGTDSIEENLEYLLNYVNSPYFTDENVEKEKNIIVEEINMYKDEPEGKLFEASGKAIFKNHPMRIDIGGTERSVRSITKEDLYNCYNTFYQPSNMFLVIGGNFDVESVLNVIKNNKKLIKNNEKKDIKVAKVYEPLKVNSTFKELKIKNIMIPKLVFTLKVPIKEVAKKDRFEYVMNLKILFNILYDSSSIFMEDMLKQEKLSILVTSSAIVDDFVLVEFIAESKKPLELKEEIINCFNNQVITNEDVERQKKVYIASEVLKSDRVVSMVNMFLSNIVDYGDIVYDKLDIVKKINLNKLLEIRKSIDVDNSSLVIGYPKE